MPGLAISLGQCSDKGRKPLNQDFLGLIAPQEPLLSSKGIALALADGISSSQVSQIASQTAVRSFLEDYYATPESWTVKHSVQRVLQATNSWLYAQSRNGPFRYDLNRGYVCTLSALVLKSRTAHLFHLGDCRVFRLSRAGFEQLTEDHRLWLAPDKSYLSRALGMQDRLELDYLALPLEQGDVFILASDGIYEFASAALMQQCLARHGDDLDQAAQQILQLALDNGSEDNLSIQILRIEDLPPPGLDELNRQVSELAFAPELAPRQRFDGYEILRELHHSHRSHLYLAQDPDTGEQVALKLPSVELREDAAYLERFVLEEWIARRLDNPHLLKAAPQRRQRQFLYTAFEYIEGQTLVQWMLDHPRPALERVRELVEQIARGLQAMHRLEMLHQDLRPNNILIDSGGRVRLIDFGSVRVAGLQELGHTPGSGAALGQEALLGTAQYSAPEYFLGETGRPQSDLFSLGVLTYQMLSGRLPYGTQVARATSRAAQHRLQYRSLLDEGSEIPAWLDAALRKAVHPDPQRRHQHLSEFLQDLRQPNPALVNPGPLPLLQSHPLRFWQGLSLLLFVLLLLALGMNPNDHGASRATPENESLLAPDRSLPPTPSQGEGEQTSASRVS
ncbi:bifunctional protein-serine/threonine kinase/phosphatase [Magnetovirga frankeli]|uniref:bifunctional protein-serine/threonine kinase/phosphatase n=1 Tax=Magnetovirga frankeli TaxID=947516 RepID=UPI0012932A45|nr:bifunctional protein-serine/threonine kinase/phosphatase [gamma proteobacterium SS-5]